MKMRLPSRKLLEDHFLDARKHDSFPEFLEHMLSGPVVCMVSMYMLLCHLVACACGLCVFVLRAVVARERSSCNRPCTHRRS